MGYQVNTNCTKCLKPTNQCGCTINTDKILLYTHYTGTDTQDLDVIIRKSHISGDCGGNQTVVTNGHALRLLDFVSLIAANDPGDSSATTIATLRADYNQLLQNLRDAGLIK